MERTITAILTNSNDKKVFNSNANTLGELKAEMAAQGIDYSGMDFMEGLTHTTMMDDASILPSNVQYKGRTTNNLVFMLSTTNKNIRSGACDRNTLYKKIKENNLQEEIKEVFGRNFTQVSSDDLTAFVEEKENSSKVVVPTDRKGLYEFIKNAGIQSYITKECGDNYTRVSTDAIYKACVKYTKSLQKAAKATKKIEEVKSPYSVKELDEIIKSLGY